MPTPIEEPKKTVRCHFLGVTQVPKATGIEVLNEAVDRLVIQVSFSIIQSTTFQKRSQNAGDCLISTALIKAVLLISIVLLYCFMFETSSYGLLNKSHSAAHNFYFFSPSIFTTHLLSHRFPLRIARCRFIFVSFLFFVLAQTLVSF